MRSRRGRSPPATLTPWGPPVEAGRDWAWREDRIQDVLSTADTDVLFLGGCMENRGEFLAQFDHVVVLRAPASVLVERLRTRTTHPYGKHPDDVARILGQMDTVEPLLRRAAGHEIDTSAPLEQIVATELQLVSRRDPGHLTDRVGSARTEIPCQ